MRAEVNFLLKKENLAIRDYNKALQLDPKNYYVFQKRAEYYFRKKDYNKALGDIQKAFALNKTPNEQMYFIRGICLLNRGKLNASCKDLKIASDKGNAEAKQLYEQKCYTPRK